MCDVIDGLTKALRPRGLVGKVLSGRAFLLADDAPTWCSDGVVASDAPQRGLRSPGCEAGKLLRGEASASVSRARRTSSCDEALNEERVLQSRQASTWSAMDGRTSILRLA